MSDSAFVAVCRHVEDSYSDDHQTSILLSEDLCLGEHDRCVVLGVPVIENGVMRPNHWRGLHLSPDKARELGELLIGIWEEPVTHG